MQNTAGYSLL